MEICLITPVAHLEWTKLLPGRFCIAPIAYKNLAYRTYFREAASQGYKVILDNGVFENDKVDDETYIELAQDLKPSVIVIPDTINANASENWKAAMAFIEKLKTIVDLEAKPDFQLMFVPQCKWRDMEGFWRTLDEVMLCSKIQWIGICRDAVYNAFGQYTGTEDQELNRFFFAGMLQLRYTWDQIRMKKWHFLGIGSHLHLLQHFWFVDSADTASLFYQATLGNQVTQEGILPGKLKRPKDYFTRDFGPEADWSPILKFNCDRAQEWAQQADVNRRHILGGRL